MSASTFTGSAITGWCATCNQHAVPMGDGTCGFCQTKLSTESPPPSISAERSTRHA